MRILFGAFLLISALWVTSCQHGGVIIKETPVGITEVRRIVLMVIGEPRYSNPNGYEYSSKFYNKKGQPEERADQVRERYFTHISILGDRRPYDIRVQVYIEGRGPEGYEIIGQDDYKAAQIAEQIKTGMHESRDKRNVIDDFQAF